MNISESVKDTFAKTQELLDANKSISTSKDRSLQSMESISAVIQESAATTEEIAASLDVQDFMIKNISSTAKNVDGVAEDLNQQVRQFKL